MAAKTTKARMGHPIPVKLPEELEKEVKDTAKEGGVSDVDVIRLALRKGLPSVKEFFRKPKAA